MKAREAPREEDASAVLQSIPVSVAAGRAVPVRTEHLDHSIHTVGRLRESILHVEAGHSHFGDAHSASKHAHLIEKWEALPINANHKSESHHHNGRLFQKMNSILE